jgi:hypothetical protein
MIFAYINYPNPHITIHSDSNCGNIGAQSRVNQRQIVITRNTIGEEIERFRTKQYTFAANKSVNDMWLTVDFGDVKFEDAVVKYIQRLIGAHYRPIAYAEVGQHC